jgi:hypothetical protein
MREAMTNGQRAVAPKIRIYITPEGTLTCRLQQSRIFGRNQRAVCRNSLRAALAAAAQLAYSADNLPEERHLARNAQAGV